MFLEYQNDQNSWRFIVSQTSKIQKNMKVSFSPYKICRAQWKTAFFIISPGSECQKLCHIRLSKSLKFERRNLCEIQVSKFFSRRMSKNVTNSNSKKLVQNRVSKVHQQVEDISGKNFANLLFKIKVESCVEVRFQLEISYLTGRKWWMYKNISDRFYRQSNVEFWKARLNGSLTKHFQKRGIRNRNLL